ncbi:MAG: DUF2723 domain-containing protein [Anaerolineaceae bacterium]
MNQRLGSFLRRLLNFRFAAGLTTLVTGCIYLLIAPTRLSSANLGQDAGDFLSAALAGGIPHPTGYPTYTLLGILFQLIPISTPVFRGVLVSLIPAAIGAGLIAYWIAFVIGEKSIPTLVAAFIAGLAWGTSPLLFSEAIIVDVHGLQSLIVVLALWWITLTLKGSSKSYEKVLLLLSFLFGLGCGNHVTIVLMLPAVLISIVVSLRRGVAWKFLLAEAVFGMIGLLVYLYLPVRAHAYPPINWGNPQTLDGFLWLVTGNPYRGLLFSVTRPILLERISSIPRLFFDQFGALGLLAGIVGLIQFPWRDKWLRGILVWIFTVYLVFATGYNTPDSVAYLLPALLVYAIWIGLAIPGLWVIKWKNIPIGFLLTLSIALNVFIRIPGTLTRLDARDQDQQARYAEQFLSEAPEDALIYTSASEDTFPLWYYHFGLHVRPDVRVVVLPLTQFAWYQEVIVHVYPDLTHAPINTENVSSADWGRMLRGLNPERPVCYSEVSGQSELGITYSCTTP